MDKITNSEKYIYPKNSSVSVTLLQNASGYKILIIISMLYMSIMLCNAILTNRYIGYNGLYLLGGAFISPLIFLLDDIIAEIYGYKITQCVILSGFASQTIFALICQLFVFAPHPTIFKEQAAYTYILGPSLLRIDLSGFVAYITANLINTYILTRWKVLLKGRKFWLRSLGSSIFSEALYSFIAIIMIEIDSIPMKNLLHIILITYLIKAVFSICFAIPTQFFVNFLKRITGIDVYDLPKKFTPSNFLNQKMGNVND